MINENKDFFINDVEVEELTLEERKPSTSKVLYEDTSKRGANTKHFRLQNGNFMAVMYDHPVHKLDPNTGKFMDISSDVTETDTDYEAILPHFKVRLPKTEGKEHFVTVEKDNREISWKFVPRSTSRRKKSMAAFANKIKRDPWDIGDHPSVKYEKADTNVDLEYDVFDDGVKESIILAKNPGCKIFTFQMKFKGLTPVLSEDKKVILLVRDDENYNSESPEMKIPPAFMQDANEAFCDDMHYEIRKTQDATFLDIVLDTDWLSEPERTYPVVIDPRVEISRYGTSNLKMIEVCSNGTEVPAENTHISRRVGLDSIGNVHRIYMGITLPELADGFKITKAGLLLHQRNYATYNGRIYDYTIAPISHPDGKELLDDSFNWENVQNLNIGETIDTLTGESRLENSKIEIDMTSTIEKWYESSTTPTPKEYIVIKKKDEIPCCSNGSCVSKYLNLYSLYADYKYRPKIYIEYKSADMYSDHQKFHTFEVGRAGTGSINLFTGKLSFAHGDVSAEGVKLPLSISHIYRHEYVSENSNSIQRYGKGWKLSVEQTLEIMNSHGIMAVYTNAQGKRHYFLYGEINENGEYTDDAGLGLTYKRECECICGKKTIHVLTDEKGNKMRFNSEGKLLQLIDTHGNISCLEYTNGKLTKVIDGKNHSAQLHYTTSGKLDNIVDNNDNIHTIKYAYNTAGELETITYPSTEFDYQGKTPLQTKFIYEANSRLKQITDYTGISYFISYDDMGRVNKLHSTGSKIISNNSITDSVEEVCANDSITFEYRGKSTHIIDSKTGIRTVYKFDANGRELSSYLDLRNVKDASKLTECTPTEIFGYQSIVDTLTTSRMGKYRSLDVSFNNDPSDEKNLLKNGLFANPVGTIVPNGWSVKGASRGASGVSSETYLTDTKSYYFGSNNTNTNKYLSQSIELCKCKLDGNILVASAWAKALNSVSAESNNSTAKFRLCLRVTYEGGEVEEYFENYNTEYPDWQYAAIPFVLNKECCPVSVTVKLDYTANTGTCYFSNARLIAVDGVSTTNEYKTDETPIQNINVFSERKEIKLKTTKKDSQQTTVDYVDKDSDIVRTVIIDKNGKTFGTDYKYDSKHNLIKTQDYRGLIIEYTYNAYGKELTRKTYHKDNPNSYMFSEYTYKDENFIETQSDPRYKIGDEKLQTSYNYDTKRNLLLNQTAVNGQQYNYSYDDVSDDLLSLSSTADNKKNENQFFYTRGYLTRVSHNNFNFDFSYDELGRSKSITVGDNTVTTSLLSMNYTQSEVNDITETAYASGEKNRVTTDIFGNPIISAYINKNNVERIISNATYDSVGKVKQLIDNERGACYNYTYDAKGNLTEVIETDTNGNTITNTFVFDANERLTSKTYGAVGHTYRPVYEKNSNGYIYPDNEVLGITLDGKFTDKVTKDGLRRASTKTFQIGIHTLFSESYGYLSTPKDGNTIATEIVSSVASHVYGPSENSSTFNYTYDKAGNLEAISNGTSLLVKYYYDGLNRLKREDNYTANKTYVWDYDVGGNILFKKEYALCTDINLGECIDTNTKTYTYMTEGWRDRLKSFNGENCVYDSMGNPTLYRGRELEWTKVRRLAKFDNNTFEYGANGIRYRKNNTVYTLDGNKILRESDGERTLTYYHGGSGIVGFEYNGTDYYFRKNLQGDVTEIYTSAGLKVASYAYDAWGKVLAVNNYTDDNIGDLNPIRYRSYYYDVETELYYLNSRYYDPEVGRFINADTTDVLENAMYDINGLNLYAYCDNNPVAGRDDEGDMSFWKKLAIAAAVVVAVAVVAAAVAAATAATGGAAGAALCAVTSTFVGAAKGAAIGAITGAITGAATGAVQGAVEGYQETGTLEGTLRGMGKGAAKGTVQGAQDGLLSGMVMGGIGGAMNPSFCFVAGTTVLTTLGKKAIETIQVGDTISCVDHITGESAEKRVVTTTVNKVNRLIELDIDGEIIQCTETHPFQVKGRGWVDASELTPNDVVYTKDWNTATIQSVNLLEIDEPVEVFNFEVEDCHTYFIGELSVLVHNSCRGNAVKKAWKNEANNVRNGGDGITRQWTAAEKTELLTNGKVKGYVGHHMKSVKKYPDLAGRADNIQFLTRDEHFRAHKFNWRNATNGFFEYWKN